MYIALVATSGSGKTTLAQKTARVLNYEYEMKSASTAPFFHPKCSFWYRIGWLLYGWMYFDRDIVRMYMRFTGVRDWYRQRGIQDKLWRLYIPLLASYYLRRKELGELDVVVDDESALCRYNEKDTKKKELSESFVKTFKERIIGTYGHVLVVEIDTPPKVAARRRVERDKLSIANWDDYVAKKDQAHKQHKALVEKIGASFSDETVTVMTVDGTKAPEVLAREVAKKVVEIGEFGG